MHWSRHKALPEIAKKREEREALALETGRCGRTHGMDDGASTPDGPTPKREYCSKRTTVGYQAPAPVSKEVRNHELTAFTYMGC